MDVKKQNQSTLQWNPDRPLPKHQQAKMDESVVKFVISQALPLRSVEQPSFIEMIRTHNERATIMNRKKLKTKIDDEYNHFRQELTSTFDGLSYVCITADIWSARHRSFIGMTAHWISEQDFERKSVPLACKRIQGMRVGI